MQHPVRTLTINRDVLGNPSLGDLSHIFLALEMALLNKIPPVIKLGSEGGPVGISINTV